MDNIWEKIELLLAGIAFVLVIRSTYAFFLHRKEKKEKNKALRRDRVRKIEKRLVEMDVELSVDMRKRLKKVALEMDVPEAYCLHILLKMGTECEELKRNNHEN